MKFVLNRNPENRNQKIPFPAMQMAGLADAEQLTIKSPDFFDSFYQCGFKLFGIFQTDCVYHFVNRIINRLLNCFM